MTDEPIGTLSKLSDTGQTVADPAEDIRGRTVEDKDGEEIGKIQDLLIDDAEHKVRLLRVEHGGILGFGATASFIPVEAISRITEDTVYLRHSGGAVAGSPRYDPELEDKIDISGMYGYYGYPAFWTPGYVYPPYPYY